MRIARAWCCSASFSHTCRGGTELLYASLCFNPGPCPQRYVIAVLMKECKRTVQCSAHSVLWLPQAVVADVHMC